MPKVFVPSVIIMLELTMEFVKDNQDGVVYMRLTGGIY